MTSFSELTKMLFVYKFLLEYPSLTMFVSSLCCKNAVRKNMKWSCLPASGSWAQTSLYMST